MFLSFMTSKMQKTTKSLIAGAVFTVLTAGVSLIFMGGGLKASSLPQPSDVNSTDFVTTWRTTQPNETVTLPIAGGSNYHLDCNGDGIPEQRNLTAEGVCQFAVPGDHQIRISGQISSFSTYQKPEADRLKLISMDQWGTVRFSRYDEMFAHAHNMSYKAVDRPDLSGVTSIRAMFYQVGGTFNDTINTWDVSTIRDFSSIFDQAGRFNQPLNNWNTSNATTMHALFRHAPRFNQDISMWDTSNVTDMSHML